MNTSSQEMPTATMYQNTSVGAGVRIVLDGMKWLAKAARTRVFEKRFIPSLMIFSASSLQRIYERAILYQDRQIDLQQ